MCIDIFKCNWLWYLVDAVAALTTTWIFMNYLVVQFPSRFQYVPISSNFTHIECEAHTIVPHLYHQRGHLPRAGSKPSCPLSSWGGHSCRRLKYLQHHHCKTSVYKLPWLPFEGVYPPLSPHFSTHHHHDVCWVDHGLGSRWVSRADNARKRHPGYSIRNLIVLRR